MKYEIDDNEWVDMALVRRIQFEVEPAVVVITWFDGSTQVYNGNEVATVVSGWLKANAVPTDDRLDLKTWREGEMAILTMPNSESA